MEEKDPIAEKASQLATADLAAIDCHQDFDMMKKAVPSSKLIHSLYKPCYVAVFGLRPNPMLLC